MSDLSELSSTLNTLEDLGYTTTEQDSHPGKPIAESLTALAPQASTDFSDISVDFVSTLFPNNTRVRHNIETYLPNILQAFSEMQFADRQLVLMALATIRAETAGFEPISEYKSKYNTDAGAHPFNRYDNRSDLGNRGTPDGNLYKGRGFIQLTGRANYIRYSQRLGLEMQMVDNPELANDANLAAKILALFILDKEKKIKQALQADNLRKARRLVNGGSHGLTVFKKAYALGRSHLNV